MAIGKVSGTILKRSVVNLLKCPPRTGVDAACHATDTEYVLSANAVGLTDCEIAPELAVIKAVNNILVSGGKPVGIEASFILPKSYNEYQLKAYTKKVMAACRQCNTVLAGGHTEVTDAVKRFCISVTAVGISSELPPTVKNIKPGMDIVVTKWIAMEEVAMLISDVANMEQLYTRFSKEYLKDVDSYMDWLVVADETAVALRHGVCAMHDVSDGGIFTALWDMAEGSGHGFEVDLKAIPVRQETIEIAGFFHLNPYKMKSSGAVIMVCDDGESLVKAMEAEGIPACVIGKVTDNNAKILHNDDEIRYLDK